MERPRVSYHDTAGFARALRVLGIHAAMFSVVMVSLIWFIVPGREYGVAQVVGLMLFFVVGFLMILAGELLRFFSR